MTTSGRISAKDLLDYFRPVEVKKIVCKNTTATNGRGIVRKRCNNDLQKPGVPTYRQETYENYSQKYIEKEEEELISGYNYTTIQPSGGASSSSMYTLEENSKIGPSPNLHDLVKKETVGMFKKYHTKNKYSSNLSITNYYDKITTMIEAYQVVIIQGATGCGKTSQVPQYILDHCAERGNHCNIVVTQPRRIAAISIAQRVCHERSWNLGDLVGYQVGMDRNKSENTRLTYMTTGVLLQKLVSNKDMDEFTHIIIDEVHERDQYTDLALLIVRKFLRTVSRGVKVILMSATFDTELFAQYFAVPICNRLEPAPVVCVSGKSYQVSEFYLQDLIRLGNLPSLDLDKPEIPVENYQLAVKLIKIFDGIEKQEKQCFNEEECDKGAVLVFLPGIFEIIEMSEYLRKEAEHILNWLIVPLHSSITIEEQKLAFKLPSKGIRKLILSTNIAESSITVPDIKYVIDFCLTKHLVCDNQTHYTCLKLDWASKANCLQRKGRAGRVSSGRVYRMITKNMFHNLPNYAEPEMKRCPLESTILKIKKLDIGEPKAILSLALEPPSLNDIGRTIILLKEVGALAVSAEGHFNPYDGELTFTGNIMANLPLDVRLSKLIVYGYVLGCLEECIIIATCLSCKSFFSKPFRKSHEAYRAKTSWNMGTFSDPLTALNVYVVWQNKKNEGQFDRPGGETERNWCFKNFIQQRRIHDVESEVKELKRRLNDFGIESQAKNYDSNDDLIILKLAICGAFYPNYFFSVIKEEELINRELSGLNPNCSAMIGGLPQNQGVLYSNEIISLMKKYCQAECDITFSHTKAYIQFKSHSESLNKIHPAVYFAVKMRQARVPMELSLLNESEADLKMNQFMILANATNPALSSSMISVESKSYNDLKQIDLPDLSTTVIPLTITHIVECGTFWAQYNTPENNSRLNHIGQIIANCKSQPFNGPLTPGTILLAPYGIAPCERRYFRARIEATVGRHVTVFFIDYGNVETVVNSDLHSINPQSAPSLLAYPALAFQCTLSEIRPSELKNSYGRWSNEANNFFLEVFKPGDYKLHGKIYSVVHGILRLELIKSVEHNSLQINLNNLLIEKKFAEKAQESCLSRQNHKFREDSYHSRNNIKIEDINSLNISSIPSLSSSNSTRKFKIKGPSSPLEMNFFALTQTGSSKIVKVENESVNSVALDSEPWDKNHKILVASRVDLAASRATINARGTTLMPNIRGLSSIIPLLFSPKVELRTDKKMTRYTGVLCGLGVDENTGHAYYPDHDMEVMFDVKITNEDIESVNYIRRALNIILGGYEQISSEQFRVYQNKWRALCLNIISKQRDSVELMPFHKPYIWNLIPEDRIKPSLDNSIADCPYVLPLINVIDIEEEEEVNRQLMQKHLVMLKDKAKSKTHYHEVIRCKLCSVIVYSAQELVIHLISSSHKSKESEYL